MENLNENINKILNEQIASDDNVNVPAMEGVVKPKVKVIYGTIPGGRAGMRYSTKPILLSLNTFTEFENDFNDLDEKGDIVSLNDSNDLKKMFVALKKGKTFGSIDVFGEGSVAFGFNPKDVKLAALEAFHGDDDDMFENNNVSEGSSIQSPSDQTTGWSVAENTNSPKDSTDHMIKDDKGEYWIDSLDPDTSAIVFSPGDNIVWTDDEGQKHSGVVTKEESSTEEDVFKVASTTITEQDKQNKPGECEYCNGTGKDEHSNCCGAKATGLAQELEICPECKEHTSYECPQCNGTGKDQEGDELKEANVAPIVKVQRTIASALELMAPDHQFQVLADVGNNEVIVKFSPSMRPSVKGRAIDAANTVVKNIFSNNIEWRQNQTWGVIRLNKEKQAAPSAVPQDAVVPSEAGASVTVDELQSSTKYFNPKVEKLAFEKELDEIFGNIVKTIKPQGENPKPDSEAPKSIDEVQTARPSGLIVVGNTSEDNQKIALFVQNSDYHGEWNPREGYWFFPEEAFSLDQLESELNSEFELRDINARFESQVDEAKTTEGVLNEVRYYETIADQIDAILPSTGWSEKEVIEVIFKTVYDNEIASGIDPNKARIRARNLVYNDEDFISDTLNCLYRENGLYVPTPKSTDNPLDTKVNEYFGESASDSQKKKARAALSVHLKSAGTDKDKKNIEKVRDKIMKAKSYSQLVNILDQFGYKDHEITDILGKEKK